MNASKPTSLQQLSMVPRTYLNPRLVAWLATAVFTTIIFITLFSL